MKHDELRSIGHNAAASLADGVSLLLGAYDLDVFDAVKTSPRREITVDFLRGTVSDAPPESPLAKAAQNFPAAVQILCSKHSVQVADITEMTARFWDTSQGRRFTVTVADNAGRRTETDYGGYDGRRTKMLDGMGRLRPVPVRHH